MIQIRMNRIFDQMYNAFNCYKVTRKEEERVSEVEKAREDEMEKEINAIKERVCLNHNVIN